MNHEPLPAQGPVDVLVGRLRAHAEAHEYIANADHEQKQWMIDLYDAADEIERLRKALAEICEWVERYTSPGHPVATVAKRALGGGQ